MKARSLRKLWSRHYREIIKRSRRMRDAHDALWSGKIKFWRASHGPGARRKGGI